MTGASGRANRSASVLLLCGLALAATSVAGERARDLHIEFSGTPGRLNTITDVPGVGVSLVTVNEGAAGDKTAARTGVTAIFPVAKNPDSHVPGAYYSLNGNGEMTGTHWLDEAGDLEGPVLLTNTYSVGLVRDAVRAWAAKKFPVDPPDSDDDTISLPVVGETYDGFLNDINGAHVTQRHVFQALDNPSTGAVAEGNTGGGTGMTCFDFKCGTGTSSRVFRIGGASYTLGALVQANFGDRKDLLIQGRHIGKAIGDLLPEHHGDKRKDGSIIVIIATDAPLLPHQLKRLARRVPLGLARTGSIGRNSSGDIFLAFSTVAPERAGQHLRTWKTLSNDSLDRLFLAVTEATEEAVLNALVAGETMAGVRDHKVYAIPHDRLKAIIRGKP